MPQSRALGIAANGTGLGAGAGGLYPIMPHRFGLTDAAGLFLRAVGAIAPLMGVYDSFHIGEFIDIGGAVAATDDILVDLHTSQNRIFVYAQILTIGITQQHRHGTGTEILLGLDGTAAGIRCRTGEVVAIRSRCI
jgi:hypothetical protein